MKNNIIPFSSFLIIINLLIIYIDYITFYVNKEHIHVGNHFFLLKMVLLFYSFLKGIFSGIPNNIIPPYDKTIEVGIQAII